MVINKMENLEEKMKEKDGKDGMKERDINEIFKKLDKFYDITAENVMNKNFPVIEKGAPIKDVIKEIGKLETYYLWVIDSEKNNKLIGIITEEDILSALGESPIQKGVSMDYDIFGLGLLFYGTATSVEDIMNSPPIYCKKKTTIREVIEIMTKERINQVAVVYKGCIIGDINLNKLLNLIVKFLYEG